MYHALMLITIDPVLPSPIISISTNFNSPLPDWTIDVHHYEFMSGTPQIRAARHSVILDVTRRFKFCGTRDNSSFHYGSHIKLMLIEYFRFYKYEYNKYTHCF